MQKLENNFLIEQMNCSLISMQYIFINLMKIGTGIFLKLLFWSYHKDQLNMMMFFPDNKIQSWLLVIIVEEVAEQY